jgi:hypothetical protein
MTYVGHAQDVRFAHGAGPCQAFIPKPRTVGAGLFLCHLAMTCLGCSPSVRRAYGIAFAGRIFRSPLDSSLNTAVLFFDYLDCRLVGYGGSLVTVL